jgi:GNAT superfamily N-acetyltransferase
MRIEIRQAVPTDLLALVGFQVDCAREISGMELEPVTVERGVRVVLETPERGFWLVSEFGDGELSGCLMVQMEWSDWRAADVWWVYSVFVAPSYRRLGVFRAMFEYLEGLADAAGAVALRLYTDRANTAAGEVYRRVGMTDDRRRLFEKVLPA